MTPCPPQERLAEFLAEELPPTAADEVEDHLAVCAACRQRLEDLSCDDSARLLRELYQHHAVEDGDTDLRFLRDLSGALRVEADTPPGAESAAPPPGYLPNVPGYDVESELGRGGMGVVYQARQHGLDRVVALKMLLHAEHAGEGMRERFAVEAQALARLQHPNIVQIHEVGEHNGLPYFALEFCPGGSLADKLDGTPWLPAKAAALVETLARAVDAAHRANVIHRDLKPANVLLTAEGQPKITDFGLAKKLDEQGQTQTGAVVGTPSYMPPEQAGGKSSQMGPACDVYALGAILYELLTGRPPFKAATALDTALQVLSEEPVAVRRLQPKVPRDLETICHQCLQKDPKKRYASAEALADDLGRHLRSEPIRARSVGELERLWKWARRRRALATALATLALALVAGAAVSTYFAVVAGRHEAEARGQEGKAQEARREAETQAARAQFARGFDLASQGEGVRGLYSMLAALRSAPAEDADLKRVLRTNLAAWSVPLFDLRHVLPVKGAVPLDLAFSPDSRTFVVLAEGGVQLYDSASGQVVGSRLSCPGGQCLAFSPDGRRLLAGGQTGAVYAWDTTTGAELPPLLPKAGADVRQIRIAPDGRCLLTAHGDATVRLWDAATGKPRGKAFRGVDIHQPVRFSGDGRTVFAVVATTLRRWDAEAGRPADVLGLDRVMNYALDADGTTVLLLRDAAAHRHDLRTGRAVGEPLPFPNLAPWMVGRPPEFVAAPDGGHVLVQDNLGTFMLWDLTTRRRLGDVMRIDGGRCLFSPDGRYLVTAGEPTAIRLWEVNPAAWRAAAADTSRLAGAPVVRGAVFTPDGRKAALLLGDQSVQLWDAATCRPAGRPLRFPYAVHQVSPDPSGKVLAVTCFNPGGVVGPNNLLQVWDIATEKLLWSVRQPLPVTGLAFSPDGRTLAAGGYGGVVGLFDTATGRRSGPDLPAGAIIHSLLFSPDGKVLSAGCWNAPRRPGGIQLWDVASGQPLLPFLPHSAAIPPSGLALNAESPRGFCCDGRVLVSQGGAGTPVGPQSFTTFQINTWEVVTGQPAFAPLPASGTVHVSPDGRTLVTGDWDARTLHLRDADTGAVRPHGVLDLPGSLRAVAFSTDGRTLAAAYANRVQLWDVDTGVPLGPPVGQAGPVVAVSFADGGRTLVTASAAGQVRRWPVPHESADNQVALAARIQLRTQARLEANGLAVYLDGPALTECWQRVGAAAAQPRPATPPAWHDMAAAAAEESGDVPAARWHLGRLAQLQPAAWQTHARLARLYRTTGEEEAANRAYERALRLGPRGELLAWSAQGAAAAQAAGSWEAALWYQNQLTAAEPEDWRHFANRAEVLGKLGRTSEREDDLKRAAARGGDVEFLVRLAEERAGQGRWPEAAELFQHALPQGLTSWHHAGLAALKAGDAAGYARVCAAVLAAPATTSFDEANNRAAVIALGPGGVTDWSGPLRLVEQALVGLEEQLRGMPDPAGRPAVAVTRHAYLNTKGTLLYRAGRLAEAINVLKAGIEADGGRPLPHDGFVLALAHHQLGHKDQAQDWMGRALKLLAADSSGADLWSNLEVQLLKEEASHALRK